MRTVTNMFIANLALADIIIGKLLEPYTPYFPIVMQYHYEITASKFLMFFIIFRAFCDTISIPSGTLAKVEPARIYVCVLPFRPGQSPV